MIDRRRRMITAKTYSRIVFCILCLCGSYQICLSQTQKKFSYGILIDNTGSMRSQFALVTELGKAIVEQLHDRGPVSIFDFESKGIGAASRAMPAARIEAAQDEQALNRTFDNIYVQGGQTMLLDAIELIADRLAEKTADADKVVILITDGEDRVSQIRQQTLVEKLKREGVKVYAIGLMQELDSQTGLTRPSSRIKAMDLLKTITQVTGGRVVFPKSNHIDIKGVLTELALPLQ
jgi:uncharacterized protein with von Willebrand factor type A (vWA) domain